MTGPERSNPDPSTEDEPEILGASDTFAYAREDRRTRRRRRYHEKRASRRRAHYDEDVTFVYEPNVRMTPPLVPYVWSLWECREFAKELAQSKVKGNQVDTVLGGFWALLDPMFNVAIYYFIFTVLRGGSRPETFIPVLISGILHWQVTSLALNQGANSVSGGKNLMLNSTFPRMLLPIASVYTGVLQFAPSVIVIFAALILLDASITIHILWWLPLFVTQIAICLGIALIFSTAIVFISDMKNFVGYLVRIMFFTSPIIFPLNVIPPDIVNVVRWMPFFGIFANYQRIMSGTAIDTTTYGISLTWAIATMVLGVWLFLRYEREFASHVS